MITLKLLTEKAEKKKKTLVKNKKKNSYKLPILTIMELDAGYVE